MTPIPAWRWRFQVLAVRDPPRIASRWRHALGEVPIPTPGEIVSLLWLVSSVVIKTAVSGAMDPQYKATGSVTTHSVWVTQDRFRYSFFPADEEVPDRMQQNDTCQGDPEVGEQGHTQGDKGYPCRVHGMPKVLERSVGA